MKSLFGMVLVVSLGLAGCGDDDDDKGSGGGASGSSGGSSATGGGSGAGGSSATGGGSATGGTSGGGAGVAGASGSAGASGTAGTAAAQPECASAADCTLHSDCCACESLATGDAQPPTCGTTTCKLDACASLGVPANGVECVAGRCVLKLDCDHSKVTCKAAPPVCSAGEIASVDGTCWGGCVKASECSLVEKCEVCDPFYACAQYVTQLGLQHHCVTVPTVCGNDASCQCLGPSVCTGAFSTCSDPSSVKAVSCSCPAC
jgi:hypothetical protein